MNKIISERRNHKSFYSRLLNKLMNYELKKRSAAHNERRGFPIAVFGNDLIGIKINIDGIYEGEHIEDLFHLLKKIDIDVQNSTAIDIGANIGNHSIEFSKFFANVICFEPNPRTFDILAANTKRIHNVQIFPWGCSSKVNKIKFHEDFNNIGASSRVVDINSDSDFEVYVKPLDEMIETLRNVSLIKIDVEGMEFSALKGAEKVITKHYPVICFEQHESEFDSEFNETKSINWLRSKGYKIFSLAHKKRRNTVIKKLHNLKQLLFGYNEHRAIIEYEKLPKATYSMIYAVHSNFL